MMKKTAVSWILAIISVGILDAVFKFLAIHRLSLDTEASIRPIFDLALHKNPGIAFDLPIPLIIVAFLTALVLYFLGQYAYKHAQTQPANALAALSIFIGALGNLIDRLINGFTTDYLILFARSAINLSDILILTGVILLITYTKRIPNERNY